VDQPVVFTVMESDLTGHRPYFERYTYTNCEVYWPSTWSHTMRATTIPATNGQKEPLSCSIE
jgi:hypothetical protein